MGETGPTLVSDFSLFPWLGTAGHAQLERTTFPDALHEMKLYVGDVPGYGPIKGTTDLFIPDEGLVVDWKFVGLKKIKEYRSKGAPTQYRYQIQLYARGCELAGYGVKSVAVVFIPRDSGDISDIFVHEEQYQPEMAARALERAGLVYQQALEKGWEELPSDDGCWRCRNRW